MMPRSKTPSFITELPLKVDSKQNRELEARFNAGLRLYNACLNEAMVRVRLIRESELYCRAKAMPRTVKGKPNAKRKKAFNEAWKAYRFSEYDLHAYAKNVANGSNWIAQKVDANTQQKIATRAFNAAKKVLLGQARKVRFKGASQFSSMEGKSNKQGLRWKNEQVVWCGLNIAPIIDLNEPVIKHGIESPVKYVRILWRVLNGKKRWFVQLIHEGTPYQKPNNVVGDGVIGLDLNISNVAIVGDSHADLLPFAEKVPSYDREIKAIQRRMQRSQRVNNPDCYESNFEARRGRKKVTKKGKFINGKRAKVRSKRYQKDAAKKREIQRRKAAYTKSQNRGLVNKVLQHGKHIKTEKVSVRGWQKRWGKAIASKSPGLFQSELKRKAASAGGSFVEFSTRRTALSQTHLDGTRIKKSRSQRVHRDLSGFEAHRDLWSANKREIRK